MKPENVKCPDCDGPMLSRLNAATRDRFWGCRKYPQCKGTRDNQGRSKAERERDAGEEERRPKPRWSF